MGAKEGDLFHFDNGRGWNGQQYKLFNRRFYTVGISKQTKRPGIDRGIRKGEAYERENHDLVHRTGGAGGNPSPARADDNVLEDIEEPGRRVPEGICGTEKPEKTWKNFIKLQL